MRVLITGARDFPSRSRVCNELDRLSRRGLVIVHGGAAGVDAFADQWAREHGIEVERHPAQWGRYGRALAGHIRNQQMVDLGADICLAFFRLGGANRGTSNCAAAARLKGIEVEEIWA